MVMAIAVEAALTGKRIIWGAPVFDQVRIGWEETHHAAANVGRFNSSRMEVQFPSGGSILYRSLDDPDNARGHTADGVVIDECGDVRPPAWYEVLRPMLIDTNGWSWAIGTPKGRNWFYIEHHNAADRVDSMSWQAPTLGVTIGADGLLRTPHSLENPNIPMAEIDQLYRMLPERTFRQEILGEFIEASGGVFRRVIEAAIAKRQDKPEDGHQYVIGCDWGRSQDYTVFAVLDITAKAIVSIERSNKVEYTIQRGRLRGLCERFRPTAVLAEENAMGAPIIEQLKREHIPVRPFVTTNATKAEIIDGLALGFERGDIKIINDPVLVGELQAYEMQRLPSGLIRYSAPEGMHDDCVIATALAWHAGQRRLPFGFVTLAS